MGKHIYELDIDKKLQAIDYSLVNEIALIKINGKPKNMYSFATKYCSHHFPNDYPIYDSYVQKVLMYYKKNDDFSNFKTKDLRDYKEFIKVLNDFKYYYGLEEFNLKKIDKLLWQIGKEYFVKKTKIINK